MEGESAMKGAAASQPLSLLQSQSGSTASTRAKSYTKAEWDAQKESIRWHYCVKKKKLHEVVRLFKKEGFFATEKQFKDRIRQWGFDKKVKMHEMKAIIRKRRVRQQQGKESKFEVRGQPVDEAKINRSTTRYGDYPDGSPAPETPREVYCYTPPREESPPSPVAEIAETNTSRYPAMPETPQYHPSPKLSPRPSPPKIQTSFPDFGPTAYIGAAHGYEFSPMEHVSSSPAYFNSYTAPLDLGYTGNGNAYPEWSDFELGIDQHVENDFFLSNAISPPSTSIGYHQGQPLGLSSPSSYTFGPNRAPLYQPSSHQATPPTSLSSTGTPSEYSPSPRRSRASPMASNRIKRRRYDTDRLVSPVYHEFRRSSVSIKQEEIKFPNSLICGLGACQYQSRHKVDWLKHMKIEHAFSFVDSIGAPKSVKAINSGTSKQYRDDENDELCATFLDLSLSRGPNHIETIQSLEKLISLCKDQGDYLSAELLAKRAEEANIETLGRISRASLGAACARIDALACQGQYTTAKLEAEVLLKRANELFGPNDCVTVVTSSLLSKILYALGSYRSAEAMAKQVFETAVERLGAYHVETLTAKAFWAVVLLSVNRASEGERLLREVLRKYHAADKMLLLDRKGDLAYACAVQRKFKESEAIEREVLAGQNSLLGKEHPHTLKTMVRLARTLRLQTKFEEAEEMLMDVLGIQTKILGVESKEFHVTWEEIGRCLRLMEGREEEALFYLEKAGSPLL